MRAGDLRFLDHGAELVGGVVPPSTLAEVAAVFDIGLSGRPGIRTAEVPVAVERLIAPDGMMGAIACRLAGCVARPVRVLFFDKTPAMNWTVPWHQDRTIAVAKRHDVAGFGSWNVKNGMNHVEPPETLLQGMLTLRLHLDDTGTDNGALDILPGSHKLGRVTATKVLEVARAEKAVCCEAMAGDILAMRLTTIHKSEKSAKPARRRILHVDYSGDALPPPLAWLL